MHQQLKTPSWILQTTSIVYANTWLTSTLCKLVHKLQHHTCHRICRIAHTCSSDVMLPDHHSNPQYDGPYRIVHRKPKFFILDVRGKMDSVSIDRLKIAYLPTTMTQNDSSRHQPLPTLDSSLPTPTLPTLPVRMTRSGRHVHFPARFAP